jgi:putative sigma-54 modulation protein
MSWLHGQDFIFTERNAKRTSYAWTAAAMKVYIRGRNLRVTDELREHVQKQLDRLSRHYDRILEAHVTLRAERQMRIVDVTLHLPHRMVKAEERSKGIDEAIDLVRDRLEHHIQKMKTRRLEKRHTAPAT